MEQSQAALAQDFRQFEHPKDSRVLYLPKLKLFNRAVRGTDYSAFILDAKATREALGKVPDAVLDNLTPHLKAGEPVTVYSSLRGGFGRVTQPHFESLAVLFQKMADIHHRIAGTQRIMARLVRGVASVDEHDHPEAFTNISLNGAHGTAWHTPARVECFVPQGALFHFRPGFLHHSPPGPKFTLVMYGD